MVWEEKIEEQLNTVVSGRYFAGMWKCFLYPIGLLLILLFFTAIRSAVGFFITGLLVAMALIVAFFGTVWFLHADAVNLEKTHRLSIRAWPYWIAFMFIFLSLLFHRIIPYFYFLFYPFHFFYFSLFYLSYLSVLIYYWTRHGLIKKAGLAEEQLTWEDRILHYMYRNNGR